MRNSNPFIYIVAIQNYVTNSFFLNFVESIYFYCAHIYGGKKAFSIHKTEIGLRHTKSCYQQFFFLTLSNYIQDEKKGKRVNEE